MATPIQTAFVQAANATSATSSTAWGSNLTVGSQVFVSIGLSGSTNNPTPTVSSVSLGTDSLSKVIAATSGSGSNMAQGELWAGTVATAGQKTLTVSTSTAANINAVAGEYSGSLYTLTLDGTAHSATGSSNPSASVSVTTTNADDLIIATTAYSGSGASSSPTGGFVIELQKGEVGSGSGKNATGSESAVLLDQVVSATGTYSVQITMPGSEFNVALIAAYKQVSQVVQPIPPLYRSRPFKRELFRFIHWKSRLEHPTWVFPQTAPPYTLPPQLFKHEQVRRIPVKPHSRIELRHSSWGGVLVLFVPVTKLFHRQVKAVTLRHSTHKDTLKPIWGGILTLLAPVTRLFHRHYKIVVGQRHFIHVGGRWHLWGGVLVLLAPVTRLFHRRSEIPPLRLLHKPRRFRLIISVTATVATVIPPIWRHAKRKVQTTFASRLRRYRWLPPLPQTGPPFTQPPQIYHRWRTKPHKSLSIERSAPKHPLWGGVLVLLAPVTRLFRRKLKPSFVETSVRRKYNIHHLFGGVLVLLVPVFRLVHRHRQVVIVRRLRPLRRLRLIIALQVAVITAIPPHLWRKQRIVRAQLAKPKALKRLKFKLRLSIVAPVVAVVRNNPWLKSLGKLMNRQ